MERKISKEWSVVFLWKGKNSSYEFAFEDFIFVFFTTDRERVLFSNTTEYVEFLRVLSYIILSIAVKEITILKWKFNCH